MESNRYPGILERPHRWQIWAAPKAKNGQIDHNTALTGDDLRDFVNQKLFPYLHGFKQKASGPNTIEYKIGEIKNKISSGYNLREIIDHIDELRSRSRTEKLAVACHGTEIAVPAAQWTRHFASLTPAQLARILKTPAAKVRRDRFRKNVCGSKKPPPKRTYDKRHPHVSTARILAQRKTSKSDPVPA